MKPVNWCSRLPAVCSGTNCSRQSGSPLARCQQPANSCPRFIPMMQETLLPHTVLTLDAPQKYANRNLSIIATWMTRPASGWSCILLDSLSVYSGIDLLNSNPGSLGLAVLSKVTSKIQIRIRNWPDIRRQLTESGIWQKITIHPSLLLTFILIRLLRSNKSATARNIS